MLLIQLTLAYKARVNAFCVFPWRSVDSCDSLTNGMCSDRLVVLAHVLLPIPLCAMQTPAVKGLLGAALFGCGGCCYYMRYYAAVGVSSVLRMDYLKCLVAVVSNALGIGGSAPIASVYSCVADHCWTN